MGGANGWGERIRLSASRLPAWSYGADRRADTMKNAGRSRTGLRLDYVVAAPHSASAGIRRLQPPEFSREAIA